MTISNSIRRAGTFVGDGNPADYPFTFKVFAETDVVAYVADTGGNERQLQHPQDYRVELNPDQETHPGGKVRLTVPLENGHLMTLTSQTPAVQPLEFTNQGGFYPRNLNNALDRLTILVQQLEELVGRAMLGSVNSGVPPSLPVAQAGRLLGWDAQGGLVNVDFEGRMESDDTAGGADKIATAEAVKKVGDKLAAVQKDLKQTADADRTAAQARADTDKAELTQALTKTKQEIADLRQAVNAMSGGSAAIELINRIAAAETSVADLNNKINSTVQTMTDTLALTRTEIRDETTAALKQLRVLALAGL